MSVLKLPTRFARSWLRLRLPVAFAAAAAALMVSSVHASDESLKVALQARYDAMKSAMAAHDEAAVASILAQGFTSVDVLGQVEGGPQMIAEVNALKPDPNRVSKTTLLTVAPAPGKVTVEQRYDMKTTKTGADGVAHKIELITLSTDTWVTSAGVWLMERTVTNELSYFNDGNLVAHKIRA